jgi:hypothetical protein
MSQGRPEQPGRLSRWDWACLAFFTLLLVGVGIEVIVTGKASPFRGQGPVPLDPASAWATGLSMIALGLLFPVIVYLANNRRKQLSSTGQDEPVRRIQLMDTLFVVSGIAAIFVWACLGGRALPGRWSLGFAAVLATAYTVYKVVRLVLEYRSGVSVHFGRLRRVGPDYDRATRPFAFWWAMGIEVLCLLLGATAAVFLWVAFTSG